MSSPGYKWLQSLQTTSLFRPAPQDAQQRKMEALAYMDLFTQFTTTESFVDDVNELVREYYPSAEGYLLDDVLALFVLHQPEHAHMVLHALLSCVIDGTLSYSKEMPPFRSLISLFDQNTETECPDQWTLACGESLRFLTHYNRSVLKCEVIQNKGDEGSSSGHPMTLCGEVTIKYNEEEPTGQGGKRAPCRPLTPWITDNLLAAPNGMRRDYFQWCGGIVGVYTPGGELRPAIAVAQAGDGKQPQLVPSTPRWAVANGGAVILSVCDDEVLRYQSAHLTAAAVPALLLPPAASDDHQVAGLPPLEPYARLLHRYYATATPEATQELLTGLLQAPSSWVPNAPDEAVQLVALLRAAEPTSSTFQLPQNWLHLHFLHPIGTLMQSGSAAEAAGALMLQILSQPALLFPPHGYAQGVRISQAGSELPGYSATREEIETAAVQADEEATAHALALSMREHGSDVERRICSLWELAYGLLSLDSPLVDVPQLVAATHLHLPVLSWNLFRPLLRVIQHLPCDSPSQSCLCRIFTATVEAILQRTFPIEESEEQKSSKLKGLQYGGTEVATKSANMAELRSMVHWLFTEMCPTPDIAAHLLAEALTQCLICDVLRQRKGSDLTQAGHEAGNSGAQDKKRTSRSESRDDRGAVASFDSYVIAAVCALACEVQLVTFAKTALDKLSSPGIHRGSSLSFPEPVLVTSNGIPVVIEQAKRVLGVLEALLVVMPPSAETKPQGNSSYSDVVTAAVVAAHVSAVLGKSRACLQALHGIVRSNWDAEISLKASSVLGLVQEYVKEVAEVTNAAGQIDATEQTTEAIESSLGGSALGASASASATTVVGSTLDQTALLYDMPPQGRAGNGSMRNPMGKAAAHLSQSTALSTVLSGCLNVVFTDKQELAVAVVPLIWRMLMLTPDTVDTTVGSLLPKGWCQVVEALCKLVSACPARVTAAIIFKVNREIRSWTSEGGIQAEDVWMSNTRIVTLLTELLRLKHIHPAVQAIAKSSDLLLRSTDGLKLEGEGVLPQLELLETAAVTVLQQSSSGALNSTPWSAELLDVMKERIPGIVRCLSHPNSHARASSVAIIRDILLSEGVTLGFPGRGECGRVPESMYNWKKAVDAALANEAKWRRASGLSVALLSSAASTLGFTISM